MVQELRNLLTDKPVKPSERFDSPKFTAVDRLSIESLVENSKDVRTKKKV